MNLASLLLCLVFAAVGYVVHPLVLPQLVKSNVVSEVALSDEYKKIHRSSAEGDINDDLTKKPNQTSSAESPRIQDVPVGPEPALPEPAPVNPEPKLVNPEPVKPSRPVKPAHPEPKLVNPAPVKVNDDLSDAEMISMMKASVKAKKVKEFAYTDVVQWANKGTEEIKGVKYQIGVVTYKATTIFGDQILRAKALFQRKKLVKWVWPTTNDRMR